MRTEHIPLYPDARELQGIQRFIAAFAVSFGTLLMTVNQFIANASISTIAGDLGVSVEDGSWLVTSYTVASGVTILLSGWCATVFGRVRLFCLSAVLFAIMSLFCGLSTSYPLLLFFRILQGLAAGFAIPLSLVLLVLLFPKKRSFAVGLWGLVVMAGPLFGPVIGGWITYSYHWSWIFFINVPLGILIGSVAFVLLADFESLRRRMPIDVIGLVLLVVVVGSYQVVLDKGNDADWWDSNFIIALTLIAVIGLSFFIVWEYFHPDPIIDFRFFKHFNFTLGIVMSGIAYTLVLGSLITGPNWVQAQLGYTQSWAGYTIAPFVIATALIFPLVGIYHNRIDLRLWIVLGFFLMIPSLFYLSYLSIETPFVNLAWPRFFQGIGFALFVLPLTAISFKGISVKEIENAAGISSFIRNMFVSTGVSVTTIYFNRREDFYQSRYVESVIPSNPQFDVYFQALKDRLDLSGLPADAFTYNMVMNQAFTETFLEICYLEACGFVVLVLLVLLFRNPKTQSSQLQ